MMARENQDEFDTKPEVHLEVVRRLVAEYAKGNLKLETPEAKTAKNLIRDAPSFVVGKASCGAEPQHPYTMNTLADFLGWNDSHGKAKKKLRMAVTALELIEEGILKPTGFKDLIIHAPRAMVEEARRAPHRSCPSAGFVPTSGGGPEFLRFKPVAVPLRRVAHRPSDSSGAPGVAAGPHRQAGGRAVAMFFSTL
ncbi:MAG: hypothetical protein HY906_01740 [Deltaproteobacteria bacterium]|nr:hypothetical protein [Deltaproteobacteria bacterium]